MSTQSVLVFLHILGAIGIFMTAAAEFLALERLRRAGSHAEAASWVKVLGGLRRPGGLSMLTLLVTGIWLMVQYWHHQPWIDVAMGGMVALMVIGGVATGRTMRRLGRALSAETNDDLMAEFRSIQSGATLTTSLRMRFAIALGIVAIMTIKPGYGLSLLIMGVAVVAGYAASRRTAPRRATGRTHAPQRDRSVVVE